MNGALNMALSSHSPPVDLPSGGHSRRFPQAVGVLTLDPGTPLTITELIEVAFHNRRVVLSESAYEKMRHSNKLLRQEIDRGKPIYGVTTGFGGNSSDQIPTGKRPSCNVTF